MRLRLPEATNIKEEISRNYLITLVKALHASFAALPEPDDICTDCMTTAEVCAIIDGFGFVTSASLNSITTAAVCTLLEPYITSAEVEALGYITAAEANASFTTTAEVCTLLTPYLTSTSAESRFLTSALTTAQVCALVENYGYQTEAQVSTLVCTFLEPYLTSASAEARYLASAITTAQVCSLLEPYITSAEVVALGYITSAITTAQVCSLLEPYLTSTSAEARFLVSAITTAQVCTLLEPYITSAEVVALGYLTSALTTAQVSALVCNSLIPYITSASAYAAFLTSALTTAQVCVLVCNSLTEYITSISAYDAFMTTAETCALIESYGFLTSVSGGGGTASEYQQIFEVSVDWAVSATQLTFTASTIPQSSTGLDITFDGVKQYDWTYTSGVVTFDEPIPDEVLKIEGRWRSAVDIGEPSDGTIDWGKLTSGLIATVADMIAGAANKLLSASNLKASPLVPVAWGVIYSSSGGTSAVTLLNGFNVSSVTRSGAGIYDVVFSETQPDADYCVVATTQFAVDGVTNGTVNAVGLRRNIATTTTGFTLVNAGVIGSSTGNSDLGAGGKIFFQVFGTGQ